MGMACDFLSLMQRLVHDVHVYTRMLARTHTHTHTPAHIHTHTYYVEWCPPVCT
jgi:hypothetical protein